MERAAASQMERSDSRSRRRIVQAPPPRPGQRLAVGWSEWEGVQRYGRCWCQIAELLDDRDGTERLRGLGAAGVDTGNPIGPMDELRLLLM